MKEHIGKARAARMAKDDAYAAAERHRREVKQKRADAAVKKARNNLGVQMTKHAKHSASANISEQAGPSNPEHPHYTTGERSKHLP